MDNDIEDMVRRLVRLENELERKLEEKQSRLRYRIDEKRAVFEEEVLRQHRMIKTGLLNFLRHSPFATVVVTPVIYSFIVPLVLLDIGLLIVQSICFSAWGVERVCRSDFVIVDRHRLAYLNGIEKLNCVYCGYANGVIAYAREVASRSEQYWCPIKHALRVRTPHQRYRRFVDYGDTEGFRARLDTLRDEVRAAEKDTDGNSDNETTG